jgi:hypothetical protein
MPITNKKIEGSEQTTKESELQPQIFLFENKRRRYPKSTMTLSSSSSQDLVVTADQLTLETRLQRCQSGRRSKWVTLNTFSQNWLRSCLELTNKDLWPMCKYYKPELFGPWSPVWCSSTPSILTSLVMPCMSSNSLGSEDTCASFLEWQIVAEPPKLYDPHAPVIVPKTSYGYACAPDNLRSLSGVLGKPESSIFYNSHRINKGVTTISQHVLQNFISKCGRI